MAVQIKPRLGLPPAKKQGLVYAIRKIDSLARVRSESTTSDPPSERSRFTGRPAYPSPRYHYQSFATPIASFFFFFKGSIASIGFDPSNYTATSS